MLLIDLQPRILAFLAALALCGCAGSPQQAAAPAAGNSGLHELRVELQFEKPNGDPVDARSLPSQPVPAFTLKPGSLFGVSLFASVNLERFGGRRNNQANNQMIALDDWSAVAAQRSLPSSDGRVSGGVRIIPAEARFAQILPVVYVQPPGESNPQLLGTHSYFMDAGAQVANLIYFDRACRLEGTFRPNSGRRTVTVDIKIDGPGFYLLSYVAGLGNEKYWLVLSPHAEMINLTTTL
jgi:hypothetical protein